MRNTNISLRIAMLALALAGGAAIAAPSTFEPVVGNGVLCRDHIDPPYFQAYLATHFKSPYKTEGGAYWHKTGGVPLYGMEVAEIFVSTGAGQADFLGVVFNAPLAEARRSLWERQGIAFLPDPRDKTLRSPMGSHLADQPPGKSRLFCVRYRVGR